MKLKAKLLKASTGGLIAMLNEHDAKILGVFSGERIKIKSQTNEAIAIVDVSPSLVKTGEIGLFKELYDLIKPNNSEVEVNLASLPKSLIYIREKLDNRELSKSKIYEIVRDIVNHKLTPVEITYFIAASYIHDLTPKETMYLTKAMAETGDVVKFKGKVLDVHCVGGVPGNRTTMLIVPIIASLGYKIPKASSRAITSPAGTADTMELLCRVSLTSQELKQVVEKVNGCIVWGGGMNLAPADDYMIRVRHTLSLDPKGVMLASILAKKYAVGSRYVLLDIPVGKDAKFTLQEAKRLEKRFLELADLLRIKLKVIITDGSQPIGNGIGVALEARDVIWALKQDPRAPKDLIKKSLYMAKLMLEMVDHKNAKNSVEDAFYSGKALEKFVEIIDMQGRKIRDLEEVETMLKKAEKYEVLSYASGKIVHISNKYISLLSRTLGSPADPLAGIYLLKHKYDYVKNQEPIMVFYSTSKQRILQARELLSNLSEYFVIKQELT